ncbi:Flp family type IVb pilin [Proteiniclasticum sp. C24MP]|uniref:Flp family type IVb pilin n=1 Tax=Proteiniclasticum sp. C24MP TaxID=3374101 RepID=UPI003754047E
MRKIIADSHGQAKVEYGLILALVAVSVMLVISSPKFRCALKSIYISTAYHLYLAGADAGDSEQLFQQFMIENGLDSSIFDYNDGKIDCSDAPGNNEPDPEPEPDPVPVPWL